jgi:hypothetical protein
VRSANWPVSKKDIEQAVQREHDVNFDLRNSVTKLARYCRSANRMRFQDMEKIARGHFGDAIVPLLDIVWRDSKASMFGEHRFDKQASMCVAPVTQEPFSTLTHITFLAKLAYAAGQDVAKRKELVDKYSHQLTFLTGQIIKKAAPKAPAAAGSTGDTALADVLGAPGDYTDALGSLSADADYMAERVDPFKSMEGVLSDRRDALGQPDKKKMTADLEDELNTYELSSERKALDTQIMLYDFMKNDEVLRRADPSTVISAFNEISRLAPYTAEKPALMRSLLRRSVEARGLDPFELKNVTDIEKTVRQQSRPVTATEERDELRT